MAFTPLSRRAMLKGLGVAMALPLLETMSWAETAKAAAVKPPVRLAFFCMPYGFGRTGIKDQSFWPADPKDFTPTAKLPSTLEPLRPVLGDCLLFNNLDNPHLPDEGGPGHAFEHGRFLTCVHPAMAQEKRATVNIGISADQVAAQQLGVYTALPSLELAVSRCNLSGTTEGGFSSAYLNTISYRSATQALPTENNPRSVLNRLFSTRKSVPRKRAAGPVADPAKFAGGEAPVAEADGPSLDQSMLDLLGEGTAALRKHVSDADQRTLDQYLDGVRALEKRIVAIERQQAEAARAQAGKGKERKGKYSEPITVNVKDGAVPWSEHLRVMADLMILAFQTDLTRVATMPFSQPYDGRNYPELGFNDDHHACSHKDSDISLILKIEQFNIQQFAYIIGRMKSLNDGSGTLLDNSMLLFGSGMRDNSHDTYNRLPILMAGRGGGTVVPGRMVTTKGTLADLYTAMLARAGCTMDKPFARGTRMMPDLS
jgi:hypothetical protein